MKKLLTVAAVLTTLSLPAASASASSGPGGSVDISNLQNQHYSTNVNSENNNSNSTEAYSSRNVNYEALYYVKYSANSVDWVRQMQNNSNRQSRAINAYNNLQNRFHTAGQHY